jgi:hypothetical protein
VAPLAVLALIGLNIPNSLQTRPTQPWTPTICDGSERPSPATSPGAPISPGSIRSSIILAVLGGNFAPSASTPHTPGCPAGTGIKKVGGA